jgi:hypothetical protein
VERFIVAFDVGRAINPDAGGRADGGRFAQGLGGALLEESCDAQPAAIVTFADILAHHPRNADGGRHRLGGRAEPSQSLIRVRVKAAFPGGRGVAAAIDPRLASRAR